MGLHRVAVAALFCYGAVFRTLIGGSTNSYSNGAWRSYQKGDELIVKVTGLMSLENQVPYSYYSLPYCRPGKFVHNATSILEDVLLGDHSEGSIFVFRMLEEERCHVVCRLNLDPKSAKDFKGKIEDKYRVQMMLDDLPLVTPRMIHANAAPVYQPGFRVGLMGRFVGEQEQKAFIHNHLSFNVKYNIDLYQNSTYIVGFEVKASSVCHKYKGTWREIYSLTTCDSDKKGSILLSNFPQEVKDGEEIIFTYDVDFQESFVKWESRWNNYLVQRSTISHWFSILSSLAVAMLLSGKIALVFSRTLYIDVLNSELEREEAQEETGWKAVHGDVFRPPSNAYLFCICIGTGVQIFGTATGVVIFSVLHILQLSNHSGLLSTMLLLWAFMGLFAGYTCTRLHIMFQGPEQWYILGFTTTVTFPASIFIILSAINLILRRENSSAALPSLTLVNLFILGYVITFPATALGSYIGGFKMPAITNPVATKRIPREIPTQSWHRKPFIWILLGGIRIISFGAIFSEVKFLLQTISMHWYFNSYGSLSLSFTILVLTCPVTTIIVCYNQLCKENYLWWWSSFLAGGSSSLYLILYVTYYLLARLQVTKTVPLIICFGYLLIAASALFLMTGAVGFLACFWFNRLIYSSLKID